MYEFERIDPRGRTPLHLGKFLPIIYGPLKTKLNPIIQSLGLKRFGSNLTHF